MNRRMDHSMKEIHKFIAENTTEEMSIEDINALLASHLDEIKVGMEKRRTEATAETADDFLDMAEDRVKKGDDQGALRLARKAQKLEPDNLDVELFLIQHEKMEPETFLSRTRMALEHGKSILEKQGYFKEDTGHFWQVLETRPYMRLMDQYVTCLSESGKLRMAAREAEEMIRLNNEDNLGARFTLMHLYAALEDAEAAERLLKKYSEHDEGPMLLALTLLYYKLDDDHQAEKYLRRLIRNNKETRAFIRDALSDNLDRKAAEVQRKGSYSPFSEEELIITYSENEDVYDSAPLFFRWMAKVLKML